MGERFLAGKLDAFDADAALGKGIRALGGPERAVRSHTTSAGEDNGPPRLDLESREEAGRIDRRKGADTVYFVGCVSAMFP